MHGAQKRASALVAAPRPADAAGDVLAGFSPSAAAAAATSSRGQRGELPPVELLQRAPLQACEPQRLRVERLLEQRAREARVAEALAALGPGEDPRAASPSALSVERVLVLGRELVA